MNRAYVQTLRRPHECLGLPQPIGRKFRLAGNGSWVAALAVITFACLGVYVYKVNTAASKGFMIRAEEARMERLRETVNAMENQLAQLQTIRTLEERVKGMGYVQVDRMEFMDPAKGAYAFAN